MTTDEIGLMVLGGSFAVAGLILLARSGRGAVETSIELPGIGIGWLVYLGGVLAVIGALIADRIDRRP